MAFSGCIILSLIFIHTLTCTACIPGGGDKLPLWVTKKGGNTLYLLGSLHLVPEDVYPLDTKITEAFESADVLVVEVDITKDSQQEIQEIVMQRALLPDSSHLQDMLPEALFSALSTELEALGSDIEKMSRFKPWFISLNLGLMRLQTLDIKAGSGIDEYFLNQANEKSMEVLDLETAALQLDVLSSQSMDVQLESLAYTIEEGAQNELYLKMLEAWKAGDDDELNSLSREKMVLAGEELPGMTDYYQQLFPNREQAMMDKIESFLEGEKNKTFFIIVGIFHLVGEDGMIRKLENRGYKSRQLR